MRSEMCLIKRGKYEIVNENGLKHYMSYPKWARPIQKIIKKIQLGLWYIGIAVYDPIFGECTPDFNCCTKIGRKAFIRIHMSKK